MFHDGAYRQCQLEGTRPTGFTPAAKPCRPSVFTRYARDAENGIAVQIKAQKSRRVNYEYISDSKLWLPNQPPVSVNLSNPEVAWRVDGLIVWYKAIVQSVAASRDYADWLSPYLKAGSFADASYVSFWLSDASAETMPLNRLTGLVSFYQLQQKVTHGNAEDQLHANRWLLSDLFFTADRAFHNVLSSLVELHFPSYPKPIFLDRSARSCVDQVEQALRLDAKFEAAH
jgi:hypothetical protein